MSTPKWFNKKESKRDFSEKREKKFAKKLNAKKRPNSGAAWSHKADLSTDEYLFEVKSTLKPQIVIHKEWLEKLRSEAIKEGKIPILIIDFDNIQFIGEVTLYDV